MRPSIAIRRAVYLAIELVYLTPLALICIAARMLPKKIDIGLGPEPMINNVYHKRALEQRGYSAETFVTHLYHITQEFDVKLAPASRLARIAARLVQFPLLFAVFRYRCLYLYFNGGPLFGTELLWRLEPQFLALAGVKTVIMPYGGDVQDLLRCPTLPYRHAMSIDYPEHRTRRRDIARRIDLWTDWASHVISGCDWVDYMHFWHTLMVAHFSIDTSTWRPEPGCPGTERGLRVVHAPNHRALKGTAHFMRAVEELRAEGVPIELVLLERVPNERVREAIRDADIVADQLVIGWYAMFAIEGMAMGKPVLCNVREDLRELYRFAGLLAENDPPLVHCTPRTVKEVLRGLAMDAEARRAIGERGRRYVERVHSTQAVGAVFADVNRSIGLAPSRPEAIGEVRIV